MESIFKQRLDRALFANYFLGAVVPMLALGYVVQRYALPSVEGDSLASTVVLGTVSGIGLLSLTTYFALRRISMTTMRRMDEDKNRLASILEVSRALAQAPHAHVAAEIAVGCVQRLTGAEMVALFARSDSDKPPTLLESAGEGARAQLNAHEEEILELARAAIASGVRSDAVGWGSSVAMAIPMATEEGATGTFVVVAPGHATGSHVFAPEVLDAVETLSGLTAVATQSAERKDSERNFFTHVIELMVTAVDAHVGDRTGGAHELAKLSNLVGREMQLDDETLRQLHFGTLLCDIGMLKLSRAELQSPKHMARHALLGHRMLSPIRLWESLAEIVHHHHDPYQSAQSPEEGGRPAGETIPLESRIIHAVETFACAAQRVAHGGALDGREPLEALKAQSGTRYDPTVVAALERLVERGDIQPGGA